jgi:hypothetical protein
MKTKILSFVAFLMITSNVYALPWTSGQVVMQINRPDIPVETAALNVYGLTQAGDVWGSFYYFADSHVVFFLYDNKGKWFTVANPAGYVIQDVLNINGSRTAWVDMIDSNTGQEGYYFIRLDFGLLKPWPLP